MPHILGLLRHSLIVVILSIVIIDGLHVFPVLDIAPTSSNLRQVDIDIVEVAIHVCHGDGVGDGSGLCNDHVLPSLNFFVL